MFANKNKVTGIIEISDMTDKDELFTQRYIGFTWSEAKAKFRKALKERNKKEGDKKK